MSVTENFWDRYGDPRVKGWFLMGSPYPTLTICISYVIFVKIIGPKLMENRKAFNLKGVMIAHNLIQVLWNIWLLRAFLVGGWFGKFNLRCEPVSNKHTDLIDIGYWYYILKLTEFGDTLIFILRKKNNQVSKLHVIHHSVLPFSGL
jgi:elongation of very long chain fatty acids protein 7